MMRQNMQAALEHQKLVEEFTDKIEEKVVEEDPVEKQKRMAKEAQEERMMMFEQQINRVNQVNASNAVNEKMAHFFEGVNTKVNIKDKLRA
jgi:hypothetical protein